MVESFDIETFNDRLSNRLVPYCLAYTHFGFSEVIYGTDCVKKFVLILYESGEYRNYYAHNLTFDGSFVLDFLSGSNIKFEVVLYKNSIYQIKIFTHNGALVFLKCSFRLFPFSLSKASHLLGVTAKIEVDHRLITAENFLNDDVVSLVSEYCRNDANIVKEILTVYNRVLTHIDSNWANQISISSITLWLFNKYFNNHKITTKLSNDSDSVIRKSYFGGRCEIFGNPRHGEFIYHFDFSGMYSQVMMEDYPTGNYKKIDSSFDLDIPGFYLVTVESSLNIPVLPVRDGNKLIFPNGVFSGLYWFEEINYFKKMGGVVISIEYGLIYQNKKKVFMNFSKKMKEMRSLGSSENFIFKLINNSLYGRMGMGAEETKTILKYIDEPDTESLLMSTKVKRWIKINDMLLITLKTKRRPYINSNVTYASIITSKARIKLHKGFTSVVDGGGRLLYTDTDSIFAAFTKNVDNCVFGDVFFDISKNDTKISDAVFALPKTYALLVNGKTVIKMKGIKSPEITFDDFKTKFRNNEDMSFFEKHLKNKNLTFSNKDIIKIIDISHFNYTKRIFNDDLTSTTAVTIGLTDLYKI